MIAIILITAFSCWYCNGSLFDDQVIASSTIDDTLIFFFTKDVVVIFFFDRVYSLDEMKNSAIFSLENLELSGEAVEERMTWSLLEQIAKKIPTRIFCIERRACSFTYPLISVSYRFLFYFSIFIYAELLSLDNNEWYMVRSCTYIFM